jgi:uroporphyrinogen decarboxylase
VDKKTRLRTTFNLEVADRPPILGGWLAAPNHIQALTRCSEDAYWSDPFHWGLEAERHLGSDGVVGVFVPVARGAYRCVDHAVLDRRASYTLEGVLQEIEDLPEPEEVRDGFDEEAAYRDFAEELNRRQQQCGDLLWCPADWTLIPQALWYAKFGYENALATLALYPERYLKLIKVATEQGRQRAVLRARAIRDGLHPRAILTGEDICTQRGPMVSPAFLRQEYFPRLEYVWEPLLEVGAKLVWHCDGDWRSLLDDVLACGAGGLQGFQRECGMELEWIVERRTCNDDRLVILGPMQVTTTLPYGTPEEVAAEAKRAISVCRDKAALVFFTSNTINPDVPLENIRAFWDAVLDSRW